MENEPTPEDLQRQLAAVRSTLMRDVHTVKAHASELVDWRHHFRRHPLLLCGVAAAAGYWIVPRPRPAKIVASVALPEGQQRAAVVAPVRTAPGEWPIATAIAGIALSMLSKQVSAYVARHGVSMLERAVAHYTTRPRVAEEVEHD